MLFGCKVRNRDAIRVKFLGPLNGRKLKIICTRESLESCVVDIEGSGPGGEFVVVVVDQEVNPGWALANSDPQPEGSAKKLGGNRGSMDLYHFALPI